MLNIIIRIISVLAIFFAICTGLKCFVGREFIGALGNGGSFSEVLCPVGSSFCVKRHFAIQCKLNII
ncbi:unnamed protein product [Thelazia callipaeda]|uniref:Uncharacterized protein n=1 Tax=Thelazia callipaeda TaxID=103827 RepID=A0A0N5CSN6_THECL|nr:unnamed protein product [Thelazia callipaeda]